LDDLEGAAHGRTGPAVVTLPAEIDITNARQAGDELLSAVGSGVSAVIADLSTTTYCDSSGVGELVKAQRLAAANQVELGLVVPSATVLRVFTVLGLDQLLPIYPSLEAALGSAGLGVS
jgi:anti-sigma B factor antagonist